MDTYICVVYSILYVCFVHHILKLSFLDILQDIGNPSVIRPKFHVGVLVNGSLCKCKPQTRPVWYYPMSIVYDRVDTRSTVS